MSGHIHLMLIILLISATQHLLSTLAACHAPELFLHYYKEQKYHNSLIRQASLSVSRSSSSAAVFVFVLVSILCSIFQSEPNNLCLSLSLTEEFGLKEDGCHSSRSVPVPAV